MKTNVAIELSDEDRNRLARFIDGKPSKRLATRADVVALCQQFIGGVVGQVWQEEVGKPTRAEWYSSDLYRIDPEDVEYLQDKPAGFVRGWNTNKRNR